MDVGMYKGMVWVAIRIIIRVSKGDGIGKGSY